MIMMHHRGGRSYGYGRLLSDGTVISFVCNAQLQQSLLFVADYDSDRILGSSWSLEILRRRLT